MKQSGRNYIIKSAVWKTQQYEKLIHGSTKKLNWIDFEKTTVSFSKGVTCYDCGQITAHSCETKFCDLYLKQYFDAYLKQFCWLYIWNNFWKPFNWNNINQCKMKLKKKKRKPELFYKTFYNNITSISLSSVSYYRKKR